MKTSRTALLSLALLCIAFSCVIGQLPPSEPTTVAARLRAAAPPMPSDFSTVIQNVTSFAFQEHIVIPTSEINKYRSQRKLYLLTTGVPPPPPAPKPNPVPNKEVQPKPVAHKAANKTLPSYMQLDANTTKKLLSKPSNFTKWMKKRKEFRKVINQTLTEKIAQLPNTTNKTLYIKKIQQMKKIKQQRIKRLIKRIQRRNERNSKVIHKVMKLPKRSRKRVVNKWKILKQIAIDNRLQICKSYIKEYSMSPQEVNKTREEDVKKLPANKRTRYLDLMKKLDTIKAKKLAKINRLMSKMNPQVRAHTQARLDQLRKKFASMDEKKRTTYCNYVEARRQMYIKKFLKWRRQIYRRRYLRWKKLIAERRAAYWKKRREALLKRRQEALKKANQTHPDSKSKVAKRYYRRKVYPWYNKWKHWVKVNKENLKKKVFGRVLRVGSLWYKKKPKAEKWKEARQRQARYNSYLRNWRSRFSKYRFANARSNPNLSRTFTRSYSSKAHLGKNKLYNTYVSHSRRYPRYSWHLNTNLWKPSVTYRRPYLYKENKPINMTTFNTSKIGFQPFTDLRKLTYGTSFEKIRVHKVIQSPGINLFKILATSGRREGDTITFESAYGWSVGLAVPKIKERYSRQCHFDWKDQYRTRVVRVCKKGLIKYYRNFFRKESKSASDGLAHLAYNTIADSLSKGRKLISLRSRSQKSQAEDEMNLDGARMFQKMKGVVKKDIFRAIKTMIPAAAAGKLPRVDREISDRKFKIERDDGKKHVVLIKNNNGLSDIFVWTY